MARHRQGHGRRYEGSGRGRVPPSRRNRKNRRFSNKPLSKKKGEAERTVKRRVGACGIVISHALNAPLSVALAGYVRVCATYYYWKKR